ncbi:MAG: GGDEF domain-containing protein, partial [Deltaproteobacteria bacterium]|nr:GGDEF domain-containing protein [Deltaproteobacteria bacterium]
MKHSKNLGTIWLYGLEPEQEKMAETILAEDFQLRSWPLAAKPGMAQFEADHPNLVIFSMAGHQGYKSGLGRNGPLDLLPQLLFLGEKYAVEELEYAVDADFAAVLRLPMHPEAFSRKIYQALEFEAIQQDALRMSREIFLEREILERKNEVLQFLVNFLTRTSTGLDPSAIIRTAFSCFKLLFPVRSLHASLWRDNAGKLEASLFISAPKGGKAFQDWRDLLLEQINHNLPEEALQWQIRQVNLDDQDAKWRGASPANGHVLHLPIAIAGKQIGVISLLTDMDRSLSRDQAMALNSALQFLAFTLNNANSFLDVKQQADYDALTKINCRRHFEERFKQEVELANLRSRDLSVVFCDIDHFKNINDSLGHQAGDDVLRGVASALRGLLRGQDYVARYGGEEFVILLPQTPPLKAAELAERLRRRLGGLAFPTCAGPVSLTIS